MSGRSLFESFESRLGRAKTLKIGTCFSELARHNDCSREILQCWCNLRRSPVVLPTAYCLPIGITSSKTKYVRLRNGRSLQHPKQISARAIVDATILVLCIVCTRNCVVCIRSVFVVLIAAKATDGPCILNSLYWIYIFHYSELGTSCACPEKQSLPWNFSLYRNIFYLSEFWTIWACPENRVCPEFFKPEGRLPPASDATGMLRTSWYLFVT